jgi:PAS domain S-box-containing protein
MVMVGEDGNIILVNSRTEKLFGYRSEELLQQPVEILVPESFRKSHPRLRRDFFPQPGERPMGQRRDLQARRKDGTQFPVEIGLKPVEGENVRWVLASIVDISERKRSERALLESEDKLALLLESTAEGMFGVDLEDCCTFCNPACLRMLGYRHSDELIGKNMHDLMHHTRPDGTPYPAEECPIYKSLRTGEGVNSPAEILWRADGTSFQAEYWSSPQRREGQVVGAVVAFIDITARKRAEEALKKSEEKFSKAFRRSPMSLTITSAKNHRYIDVNETYERLTGWRREEIIGRTPLDIGLYVDPAERLELVNQALTEGGFRNREVRFRMRDGSIRVALMSGELIQLGGEPCLLNVGADITEHKQVEEALKKSEEKFSKAFRESPMALTLTSAKDHRYIDVNETFERITGYSREEVLGRTALNLGLWVDPSKRVELVQRLFAQGSVRDVEVAFRPKDGSIRVGLGSAELIEIDGEQLVLSAIADITERKRAERSLRESEEKFRRVFQDAATGMVMVSPEGRFLAANRAFCEFLGYSEQELIGRDVLSVTHPEDQAASLDAMDRALAGKSGRQGFEKRYLHKNGQVQWGEVSPTLIRDSEGKPEYFVSQVVNITERKRVEEELRRRKSELEEAQRVAQLGSWTLDPESDAATWSDEMYRIHGRDPSLPPPRFSELAQLFTAESRELLETTKERLWQTGGTANIDLELVRPDGSKRWVSARCEAERDARGGIVRLRGTAQDITERRQAEEALHESEERFRRVVEHIGDAIVVDDVAGHVVFANDQFLNLFGFRREELQNIKLEDYIAPEYRAQLRDRHDRRMRGEAMPAHFEYEGCRRDGARMWLEVNVVSVRTQGGKLVGTQSAVRDITERKLAEQSLRESEERFRLVANAAPVMIWKAGPDKLCNYFNQTWLEFTGRPLETELGNGWAESVHPDDLAKCLEIYTHSFESRWPFRMEYRLRRRDGEYRWIDDTGVPIVNPDGSFVGYIGSCVDITDRKRGEEALRNVSGKLIEAQEKERVRIARELHDDINQRLAMLAIEIQQLKDIPRLSATKIRQRTEELFKRTTEISSDIQLLSHDLHSSSLDYLGLVPAMRSFCAEFAKHQKVEVDFGHSNVPSSLSPEVALGLFRVLQEGLHNAVKHSGVRKFEARLMGVPGGIQLSIRDSGKGLDLEAAMSGHGLGLISMRERVKLLKGTISIVSKPKHGTEITVRIPVVAETGASQHASA